MRSQCIADEHPKISIKLPFQEDHIHYSLSYCTSPWILHHPLMLKDTSTESSWEFVEKVGRGMISNELVYFTWYCIAWRSQLRQLFPYYTEKDQIVVASEERVQWNVD